MEISSGISFTIHGNSLNITSKVGLVLKEEVIPFGKITIDQ